MDSKTKVFRAHRALAWFYAFLGLGVGAAILIGARGQVGGDFVFFVALFVLLFSIHHFTAKACREGRAGGRAASIGISILMLLGFPIGTLIGVYLLANTWKPWPAVVSSTASPPKAPGQT